MRTLSLTFVASVAAGLIAFGACSNVETIPEDGGGSGSSDDDGDGDGPGPTGGATKASTGPTTTSSGGSGCPSIVGTSGTHLLSLSIKLSPPKAFALIASVSLAGGPSGMSADLSLQPLSATDQMTAVCAPLSFAGLPVSGDGSFQWDLGDVRLCGEANPISGSDIQTTLILDGSLCTGTLGFGCGDVTGIVSEPLPDYDLTGSTFTLQKYGGQIPPPLIDCAMTPAQY
jgi:hypothetical protein